MPVAIGASPTVSVVIPCYNCVKTLRTSVESIIAQEEISAQIVLVDDGSTDETPSLMRELCACYPGRIITAYQSNQGPSAARNKGITLIDSDYIAFLDSDDYWAPNKLHQSISFMIQHPEYGLSHTQAIMVGEDGNYFRAMQSRAAYKGNCFAELVRQNGLITSTVCIRREVVKRCGLFDVSLRVCEDWEYWIRIAHDFEFGVLEEALTYYRVHETNVSHQIERMQAGHRKLIEMNYLKYGNGAVAKEIFDEAYVVFHSDYCVGFANAGKYSSALHEWANAARIRPLDVKLHYNIIQQCVRALLGQLLKRSMGRVG